MTTLREAAQQALEALEWSWGGEPMGTLERDAITALKAALAEPEPRNQCAETCERAKLCAVCARGLAEPAQEPVATVTECEACFTPDVCRLRGTCDYYTASQMRIAAPPQQAEPVEPVAWAYMGIKQDGTEHGPHLVWKPEYMDAMSASKGAKAIPLFTAPPQRKPLTDEEMRDLVTNWFAEDWAIEKALGLLSDYDVKRAHGIPAP